MSEGGHLAALAHSFSFENDAGTYPFMLVRPVL